MTEAMLERLTGTGWRRGLGNLMTAGFGSWFKTSTWWVQVLIWVAVTCGPLVAILFGPAAEDGEVAPVTVFVVMSMFSAIAVAIIMQEEIVGEKKSGTAEWVLSKPVSRASFVVSKLVPNAVGCVLTMVVVPCAVAYALFYAAGYELGVLGYLAGAGVISLNLLFYLTLTLMCGTLFESAGPVIAVPLAFAFGQQLLGSVPGIVEFLPYRLVAPMDGAEDSVGSALMLGHPVPATGAIIFAAAACVVFVWVAIRRFQRTEF